MNNISELEKKIDLMTSQDFHNDFMSLIKSKCPLIHINSHEELRVLDYIRSVCISKGYSGYMWDCYMGFRDVRNILEKFDMQEIISSNSQQDASSLYANYNVINEALDIIIDNFISKENTNSNKSKGNIFILYGMHRFLKDCDPDLERKLKYISSRSEIASIIMIGPEFKSTSSLDKDIVILDFPYPNYNEIKNILYDLSEEYSANFKNLKKYVKDNEEEIIASVSGLTYNEISMAFHKSISLANTNNDYPFNTSILLKEKKQIIKRGGVLEYCDTLIDVNRVGGLDPLIEWMKKRKLSFNKKARDYGLPYPKGVLLLGIPGCGKSLVAKAASSLYNMPLIRLDFGRIFNSLVGESEKTVRNAIMQAEALQPCILWIDEVEKGLSGSKSSGSTDGGTTSRVISTLLTWLQEKDKPVFVICTANNHEDIPPEFMRAGRFDEVFFVDLPSLWGRKQIFEIILKNKNRDVSKFNLNSLAKAAKGFSGAEIEKVVDEALFSAYYDNQRELDNKDILNAIDNTSPLSKIREKELDISRAWAKERGCVFANSDIKLDEDIEIEVEDEKEISSSVKVRRKLDMDND